MRSMTGFGKGEYTAGDGTVFVAELSSVNRKQLDLRCLMGPEYAALETEFRRRVGAHLSRGAATLRCSFRPGERSAAAPVLNRPLLLALGREVLELRRKLGLPPELDAAALLQLPGVLGAPETPEPDSAFSAGAVRALEQALAAFELMRRREGEALKRDLQSRRDALYGLLRRIEPLTREQPEQQKRRLLDKLRSEQLPVAPDDERFLRELVYYLDKSDVSEELIRLESHFVQFDRFLVEEQRPVGRSLDFLIQELFREITTLGNKVCAPEITPLVVEFKTELEKVREQVQNVE